MASRFIDTSIWDEDWFCALGGEYQNLWNYICAKCDNAGIWKPNKIDFEIKSRTKISLDSFLLKVNEDGGKDRIFIAEGGRWFLTGFIAFQWFNKKECFDLALVNKLHQHIYDLLVKNKIPVEKVRGLREVLKRSNQTSKDKDTVFVLEEKISANLSEREFEIFKMLKNAAFGFSDDELQVQAKQFVSKYPQCIARQSAALVNSWASRMTHDDFTQPVKRMVI